MFLKHINSCFKRSELDDFERRKTTNRAKAFFVTRKKNCPLGQTMFFQAMFCLVPRAL